MCMPCCSKGASNTQCAVLRVPVVYIFHQCVLFPLLFLFRGISLLPTQSLASSNISEETRCQTREYRSVIELSVFEV